MRNLQSLLVIALSVTVVSGCSTTPAIRLEPGKMLIGCWEGSSFQPFFQQSAKWLIQRRPNGTFDVVFSAQGRPAQRETGRWRVEGMTYKTSTLTVNGIPVDSRDPQYTDTYELKDLSADSMTYFHTKANMTFQATKVACPAEV